MKESRRIQVQEKIEQLIEDGLLKRRWDDKRRCYVYESTELGIKIHKELKKLVIKFDR